MTVRRGKRAQLSVPAESPRVSAVTSPKFPWLPGAVLLEEALQVIRSARCIDLRHR